MCDSWPLAVNNFYSNFSNLDFENDFLNIKKNLFFINDQPGFIEEKNQKQEGFKIFYQFNQEKNVSRIYNYSKSSCKNVKLNVYKNKIDCFKINNLDYKKLALNSPEFISYFEYDNFKFL